MSNKQEKGKTEVINIVEDDDYEEYLREIKKSREIERQRKKREKEEKK